MKRKPCLCQIFNEEGVSIGDFILENKDPNFVTIHLDGDPYNAQSHNLKLVPISDAWKYAPEPEN